MNKKEILDLMLKELNLNEYEMHYYFGNLDEIDLDDIDLNDIDLSIYKKLEISSDEDEEDEYLETVKNSKIEL